MALDEYLYGKVANYFKKNKRLPPEVAERTVYLTDIVDKLTILARAESGAAIDIFPAEREGGYKNDAFFLPTSFNTFASYTVNYQFYMFRTLYLSVQRKLQLNQAATNKQTLQEAQEKARESAPIILRDLYQSFPALEDMHLRFLEQLTIAQSQKDGLDTSWLYGKWMQNSLESNADKKLENCSDKTQNAQEKTPVTTLHAKPVEEVTVVEVDQKQQEDYVLTHNFEKVDTADEFDGIWRDFDGEDELEQHQDALDELNMKFTVRVDDVAHSVYQANFIENTSISESAETIAQGNPITYPEWDYAQKKYKPAYCKVYPSKQVKTDIGYYQKTIAQHAATLLGLRKLLTNVNNKMQQQRRQTQGEEFDLDAITDLFVDLHSRHNPSDNIYIANRKKEKEISILLLLDISLSSDGYADGNRVIDVEKAVSILFGEILNEFHIDFAITCFYSKTRNHSTYIALKDFDENWNQAKYKIGAVEPNGYTRIGAALRHSGSLIETRPCKNKWIILLSDGKPNDFDKYEGKYGINDVQQALRDLHAKEIKTYAIAIEAQARYYLPQMFGQNHYQILTSPTELLQSLVKLYEKIKH